LLSIFLDGLDALPFFGELPLSPSRKNSFSIFYRPRAAVVWVRAHPKDLPVSAEELAFRLRLRPLEEQDEAELLSFDSAKFRRPPVVRPLFLLPSLVRRVPVASPPSCAQNLWDLQKAGMRISLPVTSQGASLFTAIFRTIYFPSVRRYYAATATRRDPRRMPDPRLRQPQARGVPSIPVPAAASARSVSLSVPPVPLRPAAIHLVTHPVDRASAAQASAPPPFPPRAPPPPSRR
jgi:hypothetical protein